MSSTFLRFCCNLNIIVNSFIPTSEHRQGKVRRFFGFCLYDCFIYRSNFVFRKCLETRRHLGSGRKQWTAKDIPSYGILQSQSAKIAIHWLVNTQTEYQAHDIAPLYLYSVHSSYDLSSSVFIRLHTFFTDNKRFFGKDQSTTIVVLILCPPLSFILLRIRRCFAYVSDIFAYSIAKENSCLLYAYPKGI